MVYSVYVTILNTTQILQIINQEVFVYYIRGPESAGGAASVSGKLGVANHCKWTEKRWGKLKDRTESEGQALGEDGKWRSSFQK